jgi:hypothetical protein
LFEVRASRGEVKRRVKAGALLTIFLERPADW